MKHRDFVVSAADKFSGESEVTCGASVGCGGSELEYGTAGVERQLTLELTDVNFYSPSSQTASENKYEC